MSGIPDWRDPNAYGDTSKWSEARWRWEFIRRRGDCREDFSKHADETFRLFQEVHANCLRPEEPGFTAKVPGCRQKYGLSWLPNPEIGEQPFYVLNFAPPAFVRVNVGKGPDPISLSLPDGKSAITFDLTKPLEWQLLKARQIIEGHQERRFEKLLKSNRRHQRRLWPSYLRVLDAKESGASWKEIADSGALGKTRKPKDKRTAGNVWQQARDLQSCWPTSEV